MAKLTPGQIATVWNVARGGETRPGETATAVAIAMCESGGDTQAHNPRPPDNSYGLWQINMIGNLGPTRRQQFGIRRNEELFNASTNAKAAVRVFTDAGNSFRPWSCYTNGSYLRHLSVARKAANDPERYIGEDAVSVGGLGLPDPLAAFRPLFEEETWRRVGMFVGGGVLVLVALFAMFGDDIAKVIPAGRLAKGAGKAARVAKRVT